MCNTPLKIITITLLGLTISFSAGILARSDENRNNTKPNSPLSCERLDRIPYPTRYVFKKLGYENLYYLTERENENEQSQLLEEVRQLEEDLFPKPTKHERLVKFIDLITSLISQVPSEPPLSLKAKNLKWINELKLPDFPIKYDERVIKFLLAFKNDPKWKKVLKRWFARKEIYGEMIRTHLKCKNLPIDFQYIPMVESGYNPFATSYAGAGGIWQFMPETGGALGLIQSTWLDERRNPELSTASAVHYLSMLLSRFGSYYLALAAYNAGSTRVASAIKQYNTNDFWKISKLEGALPWQTINYVPKVIAVAIAARNAEKFGLDKIEFSDPTPYTVVFIDQPFKLSSVAKAAEIPVEELKSLNPEIKKNRIPPDILPYPLRIPETMDEEQFVANIRKTTRGYKPLKIYEVRFGDTLSAIAHRTKTSASKLRKINELGRREKLIAGSIILVPNHKPRMQVATRKSKQKRTIILTQPELNLPNRKRVIYQVIKGDTLTEIARFFKVKLKDLCQWNDLDPEAKILPGMYLQIFVEPSFDTEKAVLLHEGEVKILRSGSNRHIKYLLKEKGLKRVEYMVKKGDTIKSISKKFKVSIPSILSSNMISVDDFPPPGEKIILYVNKSIYNKYFRRLKTKYQPQNQKTVQTNSIKPVQEAKEKPYETKPSEHPN